ncbi:DUF6455 family protein [Salipiger mucosus]|uniref:DUF6455 domain-containing protein n=1 Tax=Salipiger mucosus DSM 16094 TaxID=1123237 RepID=S9QJN5_9RHOB|nr:DUF6455 family protein [Salipiger mucosus]EPX79808.1 hypothetical protein Salmuc_02570 [Salipiger mucosus DSM 16094]
MLDNARITPLGDRTEHYWLVQRMARANGTDLVAAMEAGVLDQEAWAGMVERCRGCAWADGCHRWLDRPGDALRDTPEGCENRARFATLMARLQEE